MAMNEQEVQVILELVQAGVTVVEDILNNIKQAASGQVSPTDVLNRIKAMGVTLQQGDQAADETLRKRFPTG